MFRNALGLFFVPLLATIGACNRTPEPDPAPAKTASSQTPGPVASHSAAASRQLAWDAPSGWTRSENTSTLRKATYKVPKQGDDAEPEPDNA